MWDFVCAIRCGVFISHSPLGLLKISPADLCYAPSPYLRTDRESKSTTVLQKQEGSLFIPSVLGPKSHPTQGNPTRAPNKGVWRLIYRQFFVSVTGVAGVTWLARQDELISCLFLVNMTQVLETVVWSLTIFKAKCSGSSFWCRSLGWGTQCRTQTLHSLGRTFVIVIFFHLWTVHGGMALDSTMTLPILLVSFWFLLYIFRHRRSFLIGSGLFHQLTSWPRDWTQVSCIAGRFLSTRATREAPIFNVNSCNFGVPVRRSELKVFHFG